MKTDIAIRKLLSIVEELRKEYPNKQFTLDGRLVGDLGEIIVEQNYDVELYKKLVPIYDGEDSRKRKVQIKATFNKTLGFPCKENEIPDYYIGIKIFPDGTFQEIYNGPGKIIWEMIRYRKPTKNSIFSISNSSLENMNKNILKEDRINLRVEK